MVPSAALTGSGKSGHRTRLSALAGIAPAALVLAVAIWQLAALARAGADIPSDGDWERAAEHVRERRGDDELIVFAPAWIDPVGRHHLGDQIPVDMAARMDAARYAGIWELSARGARAPEVGGREPAARARFGDLRVRYYEQEPAEVLTDVREAFGRADIAGDTASRPRVVLEEVDFRPRRCIRVEPAPGGAVHIAIPDVRLGERLVGYAGLADIFTRRDIRDPGYLEVAIDGEEAASLELGIHDGWVRFEAETAPREGAELRFTARADVPRRLICFAAEARR